MPAGGYREGGGRPKGAVSDKTRKKQLLEEYLLEEVIKEKKQIVKALIRTAKKNNIQAIKEILDRVLGRSKESVDITSGGERIGLFDFTKQNENRNDNRHKKVAVNEKKNKGGSGRNFRLKDI